MDLGVIAALALVAALLLLMVVVGIVNMRNTRKTRAELTRWAERNGWTFTAKDPNLTDRWTQYPISGAGSASTILRGSVPEGEVTCFSHTVITSPGSSPITRRIGVIYVGTALPTVVASTLSRFLSHHVPPERVDLGDSQFGWSVLAADSTDAATAARFLNPQVRQRLIDEAATLPWMELTLEGQEIIVAASGFLDESNFDHWVTLLRDLAQMMDVV